MQSLLYATDAVWRAGQPIVVLRGSVVSGEVAMRSRPYYRPPDLIVG
jgi:hypothetical protein